MSKSRTFTECRLGAKCKSLPFINNAIELIEMHDTIYSGFKTENAELLEKNGTMAAAYFADVKNLQDTWDAKEKQYIAKIEELNLDVRAWKEVLKSKETSVPLPKFQELVNQHKELQHQHMRVLDAFRSDSKIMENKWESQRIKYEGIVGALEKELAEAKKSVDTVKQTVASGVKLEKKPKDMLKKGFLEKPFEPVNQDLKERLIKAEALAKKLQDKETERLDRYERDKLLGFFNSVGCTAAPTVSDKETQTRNTPTRSGLVKFQRAYLRMWHLQFEKSLSKLVKVGIKVWLNKHLLIQSSALLQAQSAEKDNLIGEMQKIKGANLDWVKKEEVYIKRLKDADINKEHLTELLERRVDRSTGTKGIQTDSQDECERITVEFMQERLDVTLKEMAADSEASLLRERRVREQYWLKCWMNKHLTIQNRKLLGAQAKFLRQISTAKLDLEKKEQDCCERLRAVETDRRVWSEYLKRRAARKYSNKEIQTDSADTGSQVSSDALKLSVASLKKSLISEFEVKRISWQRKEQEYIDLIAKSQTSGLLQKSQVQGAKTIFKQRLKLILSRLYQKNFEKSMLILLRRILAILRTLIRGTINVVTQKDPPSSEQPPRPESIDDSTQTSSKDEPTSSSGESSSQSPSTPSSSNFKVVELAFLKEKQQFMDSEFKRSQQETLIVQASIDTLRKEMLDFMLESKAELLQERERVSMIQSNLSEARQVNFELQNSLSGSQLSIAKAQQQVEVLNNRLDDLKKDSCFHLSVDGKNKTTTPPEASKESESLKEALDNLTRNFEALKHNLGTEQNIIEQRLGFKKMEEDISRFKDLRTQFELALRDVNGFMNAVPNLESRCQTLELKLENQTRTIGNAQNLLEELKLTTGDQITQKIKADRLERDREMVEIEHLRRKGKSQKSAKLRVAKNNIRSMATPLNAVEPDLHVHLVQQVSESWHKALANSVYFNLLESWAQKSYLSPDKQMPYCEQMSQDEWSWQKNRNSEMYYRRLAK